MMNPAHPSSTVSVSKVIDAISYQFYTLLKLQLFAIPTLYNNVVHFFLTSLLNVIYYSLYV
jgi:hypothetical protein